MTARESNRQINDLFIRQRMPQGEGPFPVILLLHGWTGDENAMWVFIQRLPKNTCLIAPRGIYPTPLGGYGWHRHEAGKWAWVDEFEAAIAALSELLTPQNFPQADFTSMDCVGFSQGAALCYALGLQRPAFIQRLAGLSGFMPQGAEALARNMPLSGKPVFIAHGTLDKLVPVEKARQAVETMEAAGARVTYCEDEVGHKLSANCFRGLESFFKPDRLPSAGERD